MQQFRGYTKPCHFSQILWPLFATGVTPLGELGRFDDASVGSQVAVCRDATFLEPLLGLGIFLHTFKRHEEAA